MLLDLVKTCKNV